MTHVTAPPPGPHAPLGVWVTLGWAVLVFLLAQVPGFLVLVIWQAGQSVPVSDIQFNGPALALATLVTNPVMVALLALVARRTGWNWAEYLGLVRFRAADLVHGVVIIAVLVIVIDGYSWLAGRELVSQFQVDTMTTAHAGGAVFTLVLAIVVVGPIGEEALFRGFLFRGWVRDGWPGVAGLIALTALFAVLHAQYDLFGITQVFLLALVLGWLRWRSGSTLLTIVLHMLV